MTLLEEIVNTAVAMGAAYVFGRMVRAVYADRADALPPAAEKEEG